MFLIHRQRRVSRRADSLTTLLVVLLAATFLSGTVAAAAASTPVDCAAGDSLQAAIDSAVPGDLIQIVAGRCVEDIRIDRDLTIEGVSRRETSGIWGSVVVPSRVSVSLRTLFVQGTIDNAGSLETWDVFVQSGTYGTRAIETRGELHFEDSEIYGGGLAVTAGSAFVVDSTVQESVYEFRRGGGIHSCGRLHLLRARVQDNFSDEGGGLYVACGTAEIVDSTFAGNGTSHGGAMFVAGGSAIIAGSRLAWNLGYDSGGAIHIDDGRVEITGSAITNNAAERAAGWGGGIANRGTLELVNSTVSGNEAGHSGGGVASRAGATESPATIVRYSTLSENRAGTTGGGLSQTEGSLEVVGSILAGNDSGSPADVAVSATTAVTSGFSVFGDCGSCPWSDSDLVDVVAPGLAPLADYGGPTVTHALLVGSPAIELVPHSKCDVVVDQRGVSRPQGPDCDAGAVEAVGDPTLPTIATGFEAGHVFRENPVLLSGSASDERAVARVRVAVKDRRSGLWLQDDMVSWGSFNRFRASLVAPPRSPRHLTDWFIELPLPDGDYALSARVTDVAGNETSIRPWHRFLVDAVDTTKPRVDADFVPGTAFDGHPLVLTGSATDAHGIDKVRVAIKDRSTGLWLQDDRTTWGRFNRFRATTTGPVGGTELHYWSFPITLPDGDYMLSVRATDTSGNERPLKPWRNFRVATGASPPPDTTPPHVDASFDAGTVFHVDPLSPLVALEGVAGDDFGVHRVRVAIKDRATGLWLQDDKTSWGTFNRFPAAMHGIQPNWVEPRRSLAWGFEVALPEGDYALSVRVTDTSGNERSLRPWRRFLVDASDTTPPGALWVEQVLASKPVSFWGFAMDDGSMATVRVAIKDRVTGLWLQDDRRSWGSFNRFMATFVDGPHGPWCRFCFTTWFFATPLPSGSYSLSVRAADAFGNETWIRPWHPFEVP